MPTLTDHHIEQDPSNSDWTHQTGRVDRGAAEVLAARVMTAAADVARGEATFLRLLGEFDAGDAVRWWDGLGSTAHWVAWSCSLAAGTAREHVRVARALRRMPRTAAAFEAAELSYSKVRELTRLVDDHDEDRLLELARHATASQLARTVSAYRAGTGSQVQREARARVSWHNRDDGCVQLSAVLTPEQGAAVIAALETAASANHQAPPQVGDVREPDEHRGTPDAAARRSRVDGLVEIAQHYLDAQPEDRSGEDRTMVVVEVSARDLVGDPTDVPAGTPQPAGGTRCRIRGHGGVEPETARRLACDAQIHAVITGLDGEPLAVGRTRRFGTRAQRRALTVRDRHCTFPGCHRTRHLKIHHVVPWYAGGTTDLRNLMLLCQRHHTAVHEGGITIEHRAPSNPAAADLPGTRWHFTRPDGTTILPVIHGHDLEPALPPLYGSDGPLTGAARARAERDRERALHEHRTQQVELRAAQDQLTAAHTSPPRPSQGTLVPVGGGEGFSLANCVEVLFNSRRYASMPSAA